MRLMIEEKERAHSFSGAMMDTTFVFVANMLAIVLMIASVLATFVAFECQCGKSIFWPELSNLEQVSKSFRSGMARRAQK